MMRLLNTIIGLLLIGHAGIRAEEGVFRPGKEHREAEVTYGWYTLTVDPLDSIKTARLKHCHTLKWHTVRGMDQSDFGTVVSVELGIEANLIGDRATLVEPDSLGDDLTTSAQREELGLPRYPFAIYGGLQFAPLVAELFSLSVTGGFGVGMEPYPLFYTYLCPRITGVIIPKVLAVRIELTVIPQSVTDNIEMRNSLQQWHLSFHTAPLKNNFILAVGFFDYTWKSEKKISTVQDVFSARGINAGVSFNYGARK